MIKIKFTHDKNSCISCGVCLSSLSNYLEFDPNGNIVLKKLANYSETNGLEKIELEITEEELQDLKKKIQICPVSALGIEEN